MSVEFTIRERLTGDLAGQTEPTSRVAQSIAFLNDKCSAEPIFIRTLLGTVQIEHHDSGESWDQNFNLSIWTHAVSTTADRTSLISQLAAIGVDHEALDKHLRGNLKQSAFYEELCGEVFNALLRYRLDQHTLCFVHIYRLLERISYAFPLLFAAKSKDFKNSYAALKGFIEGASDKGELAFFKKFVESSLDKVLIDGKIKIDFDTLPTRYRNDCFKTVRRFLASEDVKGEIADQFIEIQNGAILPLLITLRNRFFHFASSHDNNLSSLDVPNSDHLFAPLNLIFLNWLAVIYFEIVRHSLSNH